MNSTLVETLKLSDDRVGFVDIDDATTDIVELDELSHVDVPLVYIYGMGGIGKTSLANRLASRIRLSEHQNQLVIIPGNHDIRWSAQFEESGSTNVKRHTLVWERPIHRVQEVPAIRTIEEGLYKESETSYYLTISRDDIVGEIKQIFISARYGDFENEVESEFKTSLSFLIRRYGGLALSEIEKLILTNEFSDDVAGEALRRLGDIDDESSYNSRRCLLEQAIIKCSSPVIRYGASIGLSFMDDPHSITVFKEAIKNEQSGLLRKLMKKALVQLENTKKCLSSCED